jgi:hypothetical protein
MRPLSRHGSSTYPQTDRKAPSPTTKRPVSPINRSPQTIDLFFSRLRHRTTRQHHPCRVQGHPPHLYPLGRLPAVQFIRFHQLHQMHPCQQGAIPRQDIFEVCRAENNYASTAASTTVHPAQFATFDHCWDSQIPPSMSIHPTVPRK